ncbi:hypothetical protein PR048_032833 [Dryococelus australis]|uniref:Uncharacterized protein n=1 Tax=Dryococelus australis TaxID=614101 RepID=A0ABQ9G7I2_9NEOP|nr:hypothetical protein PR048_032833 [Dryococelus australis]
MPPVGGFSWGSPFFPRLFIPALLHTRPASPSSALKTSILRATQISPLLSYSRRVRLADAARCGNGKYALRSARSCLPGTEQRRKQERHFRALPELELAARVRVRVCCPIRTRSLRNGVAVTSTWTYPGCTRTRFRLNGSRVPRKTPGQVVMPVGRRSTMPLLASEDPAHMLQEFAEHAGNCSFTSVWLRTLWLDGEVACRPSECVIEKRRRVVLERHEDEGYLIYAVHGKGPTSDEELSAPFDRRPLLGLSDVAPFPYNHPHPLPNAGAVKRAPW